LASRAERSAPGPGVGPPNMLCFSIRLLGFVPQQHVAAGGRPSLCVKHIHMYSMGGGAAAVGALVVSEPLACVAVVY
jgi:hypothetical protein